MLLRSNLDELSIQIRDLERTSFPSSLSSNEREKRKSELQSLRSQYNSLCDTILEKINTPVQSTQVIY